MVAVGRFWFCSPSLLSDAVDEPFAALISTAPLSSGPDSELDKEEEEDEAGNGGFFFLVFLMTPVLHLDFLGCL